ncbi:MAG: hypothetical protein OIF57_15780 [Marinobacterium sp.]|nr:hypothetical protein [Marinobacterium sp.]
MQELGLILTAIIMCSLLTALLTQLLGRLRGNRNLRLEVILQEQKEWRERISKLVVNSRHAFDQRDTLMFNRIGAELRVRLDPTDAEDARILALCRQVTEYWDEVLLDELHDRIAYRVHYDWDRAKQEVSSALFFRYLFLLVAVFYATVYIYLEGQLGINPDLLVEELGAMQLLMGGSGLLIGLWLVISFLGRLDSRILSPLLGNPVRKRYRKRRTSKELESMLTDVKTEAVARQPVASKAAASAAASRQKVSAPVRLTEVKKEA